MHTAFYRKYRPKVFDDVVGQEHITSVLRYEVANGTCHHAYLFCGSRGTGKTTCAKILAKAVNCEHPVNGNPCLQCPACLAVANETTTDVAEIDAASNNSVDNVRDIIDQVNFPPSMLKNRVYIIDEVHMLSTQAFNALLKTLEEPPTNVIFILATTDLQKLPVTVISRCQRFDFRRITVDDISNRLAFVAKEEKIDASDSALRMLAEEAQGGMRDAISLLEQSASGGRAVTDEGVSSTLGIVSRTKLFETVSAVVSKETGAALKIVDGVISSSVDLAVFTKKLMELYRQLLIVKTSPANAKVLLDLTDAEEEKFRGFAAQYGNAQLLHHCRLLEETFLTVERSDAVKRFAVEMALLRMCNPDLDTSPEALAARIEALESGLPVAPKAPVKKQEPKATEPPKKAVEEKTAPQPERVTANAGNDAKTPIRNWAEITDAFLTLDPLNGAFVKKTKGFLSPDGKVTVVFDSDFSRSYIENPDRYDRFRMCIERGMKKQLPESMLVFETGKEEKEHNLIDEL